LVDEFEVLHALALELRGGALRSEQLQVLVERSWQLLEVTRVAAYQLTSSGTRLISVARAGMPIHRTPVEYRLGEGLIGWIVANQQALRTGDAEGDPRFVPRETMTARIGSFVGVPLVVAGRTVGVLSATYPEPSHFSAHHERLLDIAAAICAGHLSPAEAEA
jgi:GAF domain-containing protein